ncbi:hypothetical protein ACVWY0_002547 [Arthrobacter sp. UYNi723]
MSSDQEYFPSIREEAAHLDLQLQALEIIEEILRGTAPEEAEARSSLRWHVAHHPGQPQRALLMHLMTLDRSDHR